MLSKWYHWIMLGIDYATITTSTWMTLTWLDMNKLSIDLKIWSLTLLVLIIAWTCGIIYARNNDDHNQALILNIARFIFILLNTVGIGYLRYGV